MKTDPLFHELFRFSPESLFDLVDLPVRGRYRFESITVKTTEKRFDGFFKSDDDQAPHVFLEIQGYGDPKIYWRMFREICTFYEQRDDNRPFTAVVLFLDKSFDPGNPPLACALPNRLVRSDLAECLEKVQDKPSPAVALKPLILADKTKLPQEVGRWKHEIDALGLPPDREKTIIELLEYAILQRFPTLSIKEIQEMIQLTPLEETVAVKELIQKGVLKAEKEAFQKGELIGKIRMAQKILKRPETPRKTLLDFSLKELESILRKLKADLFL